MVDEAVNLYPNCDSSVWLRSCEEEIVEPKDAKITGEIPTWLRGTLIRNGPGSLKVGDATFKHLFDASALLHRFAIYDGRVTYQCRFLRSRTYERNRAANRIVVSEFGTQGVPDPCHSIFDRISSLFHPGDAMSDNAMISVYPFGDELYAFTETPVIHRIDPVTLETCSHQDLTQSAALINHTSHPHVMANGDVYNVGMTINKGRIHHVVVKFPHNEKEDMFMQAHIVASLKTKRSLHPSYMHTFGVTENYWVIVEQPLWVSLTKSAKATLTGAALHSALKYHADKPTEIVLLSRSSGREKHRFITEPLFFLHIINCYEDSTGVVLDLCTYKDASMIDAMYVEAIRNMQSNPDYASWFRARPTRLRLPFSARPSSVTPKLIADIGCETPRINYDFYNGRPYKYFYAIGSDVDTENPGTLLKVDVESGQVWQWSRPGCYPSEPVFVPRPGAHNEDDGVILSAIVWGSQRPKAVGLVVLDAASWTEVASAELDTPSEAPKCLHGWFLPHNKVN